MMEVSAGTVWKSVFLGKVYRGGLTEKVKQLMEDLLAE